jgi:hypothetical protein
MKLFFFLTCQLFFLNLYSQNQSDLYNRIIDTISIDFKNTRKSKLYFSQKIYNEFSFIGLSKYIGSVTIDTNEFSKVHSNLISYDTSSFFFPIKNKLLKTRKKKKNYSELFLYKALKINSTTYFVRSIISDGYTGYVYLIFINDDKIEFSREKFQV